MDFEMMLYVHRGCNLILSYFCVTVRVLLLLFFSHAVKKANLPKLREHDHEHVTVGYFLDF